MDSRAGGSARTFACRDHCTAAVGNLGMEPCFRLARDCILRPLGYVRGGAAIDCLTSPGFFPGVALEKGLVRIFAACCSGGSLVCTRANSYARLVGGILYICLANV